jgi:hypothetical protein
MIFPWLLKESTHAAMYDISIIYAMPKMKRDRRRIKNEKLRMHMGSRVEITAIRQKVTMTFSKSRDVTSGIII